MRLELAPAVGQAFEQRGDHVLIQRFAGGARFLGAVEHGDGLDAGRQGFDEALAVERPIAGAP